MATKASKRVEIKALQDKCQITVVFAASLLGDFLPIQIIYVLGKRIDAIHLRFSRRLDNIQFRKSLVKRGHNGCLPNGSPPTLC